MKKALASIGIGGALTFGAVDASVLNEKPLERIETIASERVEAKQEGNVVATRFPWKGEEGLTIKYDLGTPSLTERLADKRKKEVVTEVVDFGEGGFKVDVVLYEKPDTNVFCYDIEGYENYDFFYQPPLTTEEIAQGAERPEEIVGSYAVYHKALKNNDYKTGKVAHIPYPYIWEVNNEEATKHRAEAFTIEDGRMCVTASREFLETATYPVRIDPTFGYTSVGATTNFAFSANFVYFAKGESAESGTVDSIHVYADQTSGSPSFKGGLWLVSDLSLVTDSVSPTVVVNGGTPQWYVSTYVTNPSITALTEYYVGQVSSAGGAIHFYDTVSGEGGYDGGNSYASPTNMSSPLGNTTQKFSIYATYTVDAGEEEDPVTPSTIPQGNVSFTGNIVVQ